MKLEISTEDACQLLSKSLQDTNTQEIASPPVRSDGSDYTIDALQNDQRKALAEVLNAVRLYCNGEKVNVENCLQLTVSGNAGSGKSTWTNTLVSTMRKMFPNDNSVAVFAPKGSAAYNAGGETLHRGFGIPTRIKDYEMSPTKCRKLLKKFSSMLVIVIDERSMMDAATFGMIQHFMQQCAHGGTKKAHPWGGIPIVILVGDDFQLPPIHPGAFYVFDQNEAETTNEMKEKTHYMTSRARGFAEFKEFGKKVVYLSGEKRVNDGQDCFRRILRALRCEDEEEQMTEDDTDRFMELHLSHPSFNDEERRKIMNEATYVFANREPRDRLNARMLQVLNQAGNPVALIKSITKNSHGRLVSNNKHFDLDRTPTKVLLCKNARVSLNGVNPDPKHGLYHGSLGFVKDIIYAPGEGPNTDSFPLYVLVEFPQYCGVALLPTMPKYIPIVPQDVRCNHGCCVRTYIPLVLAFGKTAHTFQGQNVGPLPPARPQNTIQQIIIDPGTRTFEGINCGIFYQCSSRGTTMGDREDKLSSAIYFDGPNFGPHRFQDLTMSKSKKMYKKAMLRKKWVSYLRQNALPNHQWTEDVMEEMFTWAMNMRLTNLTEIVESHDILIISEDETCFL